MVDSVGTKVFCIIKIELFLYFYDVAFKNSLATPGVEVGYTHDTTCIMKFVYIYILYIQLDPHVGFLGMHEYSRGLHSREIIDKNFT